MERDAHYIHVFTILTLKQWANYDVICCEIHSSGRYSTLYSIILIIKKAHTR